MENGLMYLLDRNTPFDESKAQILDELTNAIKSNSANVPPQLFREDKPTRPGRSSRKTIISGITAIKS